MFMCVVCNMYYVQTIRICCEDLGIDFFSFFEIVPILYYVDHGHRKHIIYR